MTRLLVVSFHFPPDPAIGSLRWAGFTKYLTGWGWESHVVTAATGDADLPPGVAVTRVPRRTTVNDRYRAVRLRQRAQGGGRDMGRREPMRPSGPTRLREEIATLLSFPDHGRGWILRAARHVRHLVASFHPSLVVSSGPPHAAHLAAWFALRGNEVPWVVDLRDPWAGPLTDAWIDSPIVRSQLAGALTRRLERLVARSATVVTGTTEQFVTALRKTYPATRVEWIPNGVDDALLPEAPVDQYAGLAVAYVGTLYGGRNLDLILRAFRRFLDTHPEAAAASRVRVAGPCEERHGEEFTRRVGSLGLGGHVDRLGTIPRPAALALVARSRLAVVLAQGQEYQVPAKLYELVAMGVPTLVIASPEDASWTEAARLGAFPVRPDDVEGVAAVMHRAWVEGGEGRAPAPRARDWEQCTHRTMAESVHHLLSSAL